MKTLRIQKLKTKTNKMDFLCLMVTGWMLLKFPMIVDK